jgi:hypothetical protein
MRDPLRTGPIEAANFVRTVEPARRPAGASGRAVRAIRCKRRNQVGASTCGWAWAAGLTRCPLTQGRAKQGNKTKAIFLCRVDFAAFGAAPFKHHGAAQITTQGRPI